MAKKSSLQGTFSVIPPISLQVQGLWRFERPSHFLGRSRSTADHLLHFVERGSYRLTVSGRSREVVAPAIIWYHGAEAVAWEGGSEPVVFYSCAFFCAGLAPPPLTDRVQLAPAAAKQAFAELFMAAESSRDVRGALRFHEVSCRWLTTILDAFAMDAVGDPWDQVEQHAVQSGFRPSLAELADWSGKSLSSLDRACRQRHGCSPGQRLRQVRLAYAQALASQGGLARPAVARLAGYADRRSLRRALQRD